MIARITVSSSTRRSENANFDTNSPEKQWRRRSCRSASTLDFAIVPAIATREGCSPRRVTMLISLAFLSPDLVKAAVEGRLPRGVGLARLVDPPLAWAEQWRMLGLAQQSSPKSP